MLLRAPPTTRWCFACPARPAPARRPGKASSKSSSTVRTAHAISAATTMLDFDTAQARLAAAGGHPSIAETCPLIQARGRVLAQTLFAALDQIGRAHV